MTQVACVQFQSSVMLALPGSALSVQVQQLGPRAFAANPVGISFAALGVPCADGVAIGTVGGVPDSVHRTAPGDRRRRFTTSLLAGSALAPAGFARGAPDRRFGASLVVIAPAGEYVKDRLINIGTSRRAYKPEPGGSRQPGRWDLEGSIAAWFFTDNGDFVEGPEQQDPIGAIHGHARAWQSTATNAEFRRACESAPPARCTPIGFGVA